ncbi:MAG: polyhydroxyalkanoate synthesis regulator DNA-binding domain-containing protein [bacterium]
MSEPRVIKRYANRKLYDTQHSCYVTLEQIAAMIREGEDVQIIDNNSKDDLTSVTLAQIIFEEEKKRRLLPLVGLRSIIQTSGESIQDFAKQIGREVDSAVVKVFRRGQEGEAGEAEPGAVSSAPDGGATSGDEGTVRENPKTTAAFREFLESSQRRLDEWQSQVDLQVRKVVDNIHPLPRLQKDLQAVMSKIEALEKRLTDLEK